MLPRQRRQESGSTHLHPQLGANLQAILLQECPQQVAAGEGPQRLKHRPPSGAADGTICLTQARTAAAAAATWSMQH